MSVHDDFEITDVTDLPDVEVSQEEYNEAFHTIHTHPSHEITLEYCYLIGVFLAYGKIDNSRQRVNFFCPNSQLDEMIVLMDSRAKWRYLSLKDFWYGTASLRFFPQERCMIINVLDVLDDVGDVGCAQKKRITEFLRHRIKTAVAEEKNHFTEKDCFLQIAKGFFFAKASANSADLKVKKEGQEALLQPGVRSSTVISSSVLCRDMCKLLRDDLGLNPILNSCGNRRGVMPNARGILELFNDDTFVILVKGLL
jgi:hypothetical protein